MEKELIEENRKLKRRLEKAEEIINICEENLRRLSIYINFQEKEKEELKAQIERLKDIRIVK